MTTPRGRSSGYQRSTPVGSHWNSQYEGATPRRTPTSRARAGPPQAYMPRQGLFEGEHVFNLFDNSSDDEVDDRGIPFYQSQRQSIADSNHFSSTTTTPVHTYNTPSAPPPNEPPMDFVALFQEQQAMLQKIVQQQENMQKKQEQLLEKQKTSEEKITHLEENLCSELTSDSNKQKSRVTRQLTVWFSFHDKMLIILLEFSGFYTRQS